MLVVLFQAVEDAVRGIEYPLASPAVKVCTPPLEETAKSIPLDVATANVCTASLCPFSDVSVPPPLTIPSVDVATHWVEVPVD